MSYPTFTTTPPWSLVKGGFHKAPKFSSATQKPAAGRGRSSISFMPYPTWNFEVDLNAIAGTLGYRDAGSILQSFVGLYMKVCAGGGFWLFTDPVDNQVSQTEGVLLNVTPGAAAPMGTQGDGVSTQFQLARAIDQGTDILQNVQAEFYVNGAPGVGTISASGVVTFATAPAAGAMLSWDGAFQYLVQFTEDSLKDLATSNKNLSGFLWDCGSIAFESVFV